MKRINRLAAPALAAVLLLGVAAPASAYFTAWDAASGGVTITKPGTDITEKYGNGEKQVRITNNEESVPVWVRARAYIPADLLGEYTKLNGEVHEKATVGGEGWTATGDVTDWYTYDYVLKPGESANDLLVHFEFPFTASEVKSGEDSSSTEVTDDPEADKSMITVTKADGTEYNVVVIYEYQPVVFEGKAPNATPVPANWN